jgi:carboxypeptidase Taq
VVLAVRTSVVIRSEGRSTRAARQSPGIIGGRFQSYTIDNILSAQFYAAAVKAHPDILHEIATGKFGTLHTWLRDNLYRHGSKFAPNDLVERATGALMQMRPYLDYLHEKYGALYRLPPGSNH